MNLPVKMLKPMPELQLNANLTQRVVIRPDDYSWVDSPAVKRLPGQQALLTTRRYLTFRNTRTEGAKRFWCYRVCFQTSMATTLQEATFGTQ
jgi:hypothetical protein